MSAERGLRGRVLEDMISVEGVVGIARWRGFGADPRDAVVPAHSTGTSQSGEAEAWCVGYGIARRVRDRKRLDGLPTPDARLAALAGTTADALIRTHRRSDGLCFVLARSDGGVRLVLRSRWKTGRRFELARLIGDRVLAARVARPAETLFPATRTCSYRQRRRGRHAGERPL